jgi:hypothetical protein
MAGDDGSKGKAAADTTTIVASAPLDKRRRRPPHTLLAMSSKNNDPAGKFREKTGMWRWPETAQRAAVQRAARASSAISRRNAMASAP